MGGLVARPFTYNRDPSVHSETTLKVSDINQNLLKQEALIVFETVRGLSLSADAPCVTNRKLMTSCKTNNSFVDLL